jgi:hypothetical protein
MRKILALGFLVVFAFAFAVGVMTTTAQAIELPWIPDHCWHECYEGFWRVCCEGTPFCYYHLPPIPCP